MIVMHGKLTAVALSTMGSSAGSQSGVAATQIAEWAPDTELYRSEADDLGLRTRHDRSPDPTRQHVGGGVDWPIPASLRTFRADAGLRARTRTCRALQGTRVSLAARPEVHSFS
jgi:hypothetical protein